MSYDEIVNRDDKANIRVCKKYVMSFLQNTYTISLYIKSHIDYWVTHVKDICVFFSPHLISLLCLFHRIEASESFIFKK
jgi:hypothetical protein